MAERELTPYEECFVRELEIDRDEFLGARIDGHQVVRRDPYFIAERVALKLDQPVLPQIHGLELRKNLRFGNHMVALSNMLAVARTLGVSQVFLPEHPLFRPNFTVQGVHFTQSPPEENHSTLRGTFFYRHTFREILEGTPGPVETFHQFRDALLPFSGDGAIGKTRVRSTLWWHSVTKRLSRDITIHIRAGDIFSGDNPHPGYWQPPLDYYKEAIKRASPKTVTLVYEDTANPVIPALVEWLHASGLRYRLIGGPIEEALFELVTAHRVVAGRGSFLAPILAMNQNVAEITSFGDGRYTRLPKVSNPSRGKEPKIRVTVVPVGEYEKLVSPWRNSEEQRDTMLNYQLSSDQKVALQAK